MSLDIFPLVLLFLCSFTTADEEVSCDVGARCVLPCSFPAGGEEVIHWILVPIERHVHLFYNGQDQELMQDPLYSGRTALFSKGPSRGNASLSLTRVTVQDQGRYKCHCNSIITNKESFVDLYVNAPVRKVDTNLTGNVFSCSSEGIYPQPELTWSTDPPSHIADQQKPSIRQNQELLYEISSSLSLAPDGYESVSCTVNTRRNKKKVTYLKEQSVVISGPEATLHCGDALTHQTSLVWRFNHSQVVLIQRAPGDPRETISEEWRPHVKKNGLELRTLELKDLSSRLKGVYSCEVSNEEETRVTRTQLRVEESPESSSPLVLPIIFSVLFLLGLVAAGGVVFLVRRRHTVAGEKKTTAVDAETSVPLREN